MDAIENLKQDVREGRIGADRLIDLVVTLQRELQVAKQRIVTLEKQLAGTTAKIDEPFSVREEEKRQETRGKKKRQRKKKDAPRTSPKAKAIRAIPSGNSHRLGSDRGR